MGVLHILPREQELWRSAAEEEMQSLKEHHVWKMTDFPPDRKTISCNWMFKGKPDGDGKMHTYKARLVARGFSQ